MNSQFGVGGQVFLSMAMVLSVLVVISPRKFFRVLGLGKEPRLAAPLAPAFRVLGVMTGLGCAYWLFVRPG